MARVPRDIAGGQRGVDREERNYYVCAAALPTRSFPKFGRALPRFRRAIQFVSWIYERAAIVLGRDNFRGSISDRAERPKAAQSENPVEESYTKEDTCR